MVCVTLLRTGKINGATMIHPFNLPRSLPVQALLVVTLLISIVMASPGDLNTPAAPNGIVSFELAGNTAKTQAILDSGTHRPGYRGYIRAGFLYLCVYSTTVGLGCLLAGGN
jgi:hypothetical protein